MLTKLRLFVKEHMEYWLMGLGSSLLAVAFGLFVEASNVSVQDKPSGISWHAFLWLSLSALILSIIFWIWSGIIFRRKDRQREAENKAREKREVDRSKKDEERVEVEIKALARFLEINAPVTNGTFILSKPDVPKEDTNATS